MGRWTANSTWKARTEGSGPHCTPVGVGTPTLPPRPLSAARAPSRQLPPFLPPRSQPRAPPQPRGPGRPGGCPHTHTPRCRFRRPRPGPRPDPAADPAAPASHGPAEGPGHRRDPRPPRPGPPCPQANRSRVTSRVPRGARSPRAWAARSRRRRRAEVELTGSESPARGRKPASLGNVAAGANKRPRPAPSAAAGAPRGGGGVGPPALTEPRVSHLVRRQPWRLEVGTFQKWFCFRVHAGQSKQILGICCRVTPRGQCPLGNAHSNSGNAAGFFPTVPVGSWQEGKNNLSFCHPRG